MINKLTSRREAEEYRYGQWGGNPSGRAYDPERCAEEVMERERGGLFHQCTRRPGLGPDGIFCRQHSPEYEAKKRAEWQAKYDAEREADERRYERMTAKDDALDLLADVARWIHSNRALAEEDEWLGRIRDAIAGNVAVMERMEQA